MEISCKDIFDKIDELEEKYFKAKTDSERTFYNMLIKFYIKIIIEND